MIPGRHPRGSFRVVMGDGDPVARDREPRRPIPVGVWILSAVVLSWIGSVAMLWGAYTLCRAVGRCW